ncbi:sigma-70 family RNA polymerase sigma factor [bacterium D16-51]|nr:sigma-70 family RNA polymerase sigma factor [bacterium D16-59]RKI56667.1 sigma-70 family RNA polymerase sigma factor [bacterium D16-51]
MEDLVECAKAGNSESFVSLIEKHKQSMYKVARSYLNQEEDIADVLQESILKCYVSLPQLRENRYFKTWLIRIVINECKKVLADKGKEIKIEDIPETGIWEYGYDKEIEYPHYIVNGADDVTYLPDGGMTWKNRENEVILELKVTCYIANKDARKKVSYSEIDKKTNIRYYKDDMVGPVALWKEKEDSDSLYARFVYEDVVYELSGEANMDQMMEAVAAFYE